MKKVFFVLIAGNSTGLLYLFTMSAQENDTPVAIPNETVTQRKLWEYEANDVEQNER